MQVQRIQSHNTNFGYNIQLNNRLMQNLSEAKRNKAYFDVFKNLVEWTNKTEQQVKTAEYKNKPELMDKLLRVFLPIKVVLTDMIDAHFPKLNYKAKEIEAYEEDLKQKNLTEKDDHWINTLIEHMKMEDVDDEGLQYAKNTVQNGEEMVSPATFMIIRSALGGAGLGLLGMQQVDDNEVSDEEDVVDEQQVQQSKEEKEHQAKIEMGKKCVREYQPLTEKEKMGLASLAGMEELKKTLTKYFITPLKNPAKAKYNEEHYGIKRPTGFLFFGPHGCGKTTLIERLSVETGLPLLVARRDTMGSIYVDGAELNLGAIFDYAESIATEEKPIILFIDEIDTFAGNRQNANMQESKKSEIGVLLQRIPKAQERNVIVVGATNNYKGIDPALQSRLRKQIYIGLPDKECRKSIIKMKLEEKDNGKKLANDEVALDKIANLTDKLPTRALENIMNDVYDRTMIDEDNFRDVSLDDFEIVIANPEHQNQKVKEEEYKTDAARKPIGFNFAK